MLAGAKPVAFPARSRSDGGERSTLLLPNLDGVAEATHPWGSFETPFDALGGEARIRAIVDRFYDIIDADAPVLRAMLPKDDSVSRDKLHAYLVEWTGGPALYTPTRGHPRMRMRHIPFAIGETEVETWLACMMRSLDDSGVTDPVRAFLDDRLTALAHHMRNQ
jgi:hemoglobin